MYLSRNAIQQISANKTSVNGKIYTDVYRNQYKGLPDGTLILFYESSPITSLVDTTTIDLDIPVNTKNLTATLKDTAITAGTYGSAVNVPQIKFDAQGRATSAINVPIALSPGVIALTNNNILVGSATNLATDVAMSGEASIVTSGAITLANSAIIGKVLTGYVSGAGVLAATDTILQAFNKLNGNLTGWGLASVLGVSNDGGGLDIKNVLNLRSATNAIIVDIDGGVLNTATGGARIDFENAKLISGTYALSWNNFLLYQQAWLYDANYTPFSGRQIPDAGWVSTNFAPITGGSYLPLVGGTLTGNLLFSLDDTLDIGASLATRPRRIYIGTEVVSPLFTGNLTGNATTATTTTNIAGGTLGAISYQSGVGTTTILAATATAGQMLRSGASAAPTWSTNTFPDTTGVGQILYATAANVISSSSDFVRLTTGQLLIGSATQYHSAYKTEIHGHALIRNTGGLTTSFTQLDIEQPEGTALSGDGFSLMALGSAYNGVGAFSPDSAFFGANANLSAGIGFTARHADGTQRFYTGGTAVANERMRITALGDVQINRRLGVNTLAPKIEFQATQTTASSVYPTLGTASGIFSIINSAGLYGMFGGIIHSNGQGWLQVMRQDANAIAYPLILQPSGSIVGIGVTAPTAVLHLKAGTATASNAPLKFTSGTSLTTAEAGAMEYNGTNLFFTRTGTTRESMICSNAVNTVSPTAPNRTITIVIDGVILYLHAKTTND